MFGLHISESRQRYWGARAIYKNYYVDLLADRQTMVDETNDPDAGAAFFYWINHRALPWLQEEVSRLCLSQSDPQVLELSEYRYTLRASTNASYGYLYIGAIEHTSEMVEPVLNDASGEMEPIEVINGQQCVVECEIPTCGTKGTVKINDLGHGTVVGYYNEVYTNDRKLICLLVKLDKPSKRTVDNAREWDSREAVRNGILKEGPAKDGYPDTRSAQYKAWAKNWAMRPVVVWPKGFVPDTVAAK